jgi:hypothetical protein
MGELRDALAEIQSIRTQIARFAEFRGYGPATLSATGLLALGIAAVQSLWQSSWAHGAVAYLAVWTVTAVLALSVITVETILRSRRIHPVLAIQMTQAALEQFLPPLVAGLLLMVALFVRAPQSLWMLPGIWQLLFAQGVFASRRFLPKPIFWVGVWYLATGLACLTQGHGAWEFSPWEMGIPFGIGQLLVAATLRFGYDESDESV